MTAGAGRGPPWAAVADIYYINKDSSMRRRAAIPAAVTGTQIRGRGMGTGL